MAKLTEDELKALVAGEIRSSTLFDKTEMSDKRRAALEYYNGDMPDLPAMPGRSSVTSRDVPDTIGWMLPGVIRVFSASDQMATFEPQKPSDEEAAEQATDYCNYIFWKDNDGYRILYAGTHDSLLHGNGIGKIWFDPSEDTEVTEHTRVTYEQAALLLGEEGVEIVAASEAEEPDMVQQEVQPGQVMDVPVQTFDLRLKRVNKRGRIRIEIIPPENFLIDKDATTVKAARFTAHRSDKTRSELIEMGFDRTKVESLPALSLSQAETEEKLAREGYTLGLRSNTDKSEDIVALYECYMRSDVNDDGVSEMVRIFYAGQGGAGELLDWEECDDEHPFFDIPCNPVPHSWVAGSVTDDTKDIARIKTALIRQVLDNLYASNLPMPDVEEGSVLNMDALMNPGFGQPIIRKKGAAPVNWQQVPFVAGPALEAIQFFDTVIEKRTGVSRMTMALDPEALQNQTATANQNAKDAAYSQIELIARNHAELGWRVMFQKMLRLVVKHQDRPRTIRLRDQWVEIDPRVWNAGMDCTVNVGLGTGSRDRDMQMLQAVLMNQNALTQAFVGSGLKHKAVEMLPMVLTTMRKIAESAGLRSVDQFYPEIDEAELAQIKEAAMQPQADPKAEAEQAKMQADMQLEMAKMQAAQAKEVAQMQADLQVKAAERQTQIELSDRELAFKREELALKMALEEQKLQMQHGQAMAQAQAKQAPVISMGADGEAVQSSLAALAAEIGAMIREQNAAMFAAVTAPKRVIRDETGRPVGVETVVN